MANKRWDALRGSIGFYATMAACLAAIGVSSYFLLFDRETEPLQETQPQEAVMPTESEAVLELPDLWVPEEEPEAVGTAVSAPAKVQTLPAPAIPADNTPVVAQAPITTVPPLTGEVVTAFSVDELLYNETLADWRVHDGVDIAAQTGAPVMAACAGTVAAVTEDALMGTTITIDHDDGYQTTYANLESNPAVKASARVAAGEIIGTVGDAALAESAQGPHLHFSVSKNGELVDPNKFLD